MNIMSLIFVSGLIFIGLIFSKVQKLDLEKDIIIGVLRAIVQLSAIGLILEFIFGLENPLITIFLIIIMVFNASKIAAVRGYGIPKVSVIAFFSILIGTVLTLSILTISGAIKFTPSQIIPISGMIVGNSMTAVGLTFKQLKHNFKEKVQEVEVKLSLGATDLDASKELIRDAVKTGMIPTIDTMKTLGIVQLPGMMTGLILAGERPIIAIQYQIMVTFMLLSTVSISTYLAGFIGYRGFFNSRHQLVNRR